MRKKLLQWLLIGLLLPNLLQGQTADDDIFEANRLKKVFPDDRVAAILVEEEYNFGTINQGEVVSHTFKFKNTGSEPLIITDAKATCGCTVPKKPNEPIAPGETGELVVEFNSAGKSGAQTKQVTVTANTNPPQSFIRIVSDIKVKDAAAGAQAAH